MATDQCMGIGLSLQEGAVIRQEGGGSFEGINKNLQWQNACDFRRAVTLSEIA